MKKPIHISTKDLILIWTGVIFGTVSSKLLDEGLAESDCSKVPSIIPEEFCRSYANGLAWILWGFGMLVLVALFFIGLDKLGLVRAD